MRLLLPILKLHTPGDSQQKCQANIKIIWVLGTRRGGLNDWDGGPGFKMNLGSREMTQKPTVICLGCHLFTEA